MRTLIILSTVFLAGSAAVLFTLSNLSRPTKYQFTAYKITARGGGKKMTWVSKVNGRIACSDMAIYKRNFYPDWVMTDSVCVDGRDQASQFLNANYNELLREKFNQKTHAQAYSHFKDMGGNQSLIYFSNPPQSLDQKILGEIEARFKGKASGWTTIQPREPQPA